MSSVKKITGKKFGLWQNNSSLFTDNFFLPGYLKTIELKNINLLPDHSLFC